MKQKLLTLFVLLVSAMTAFANATGSGVATKADNGTGLAENQYVSYSYKFTEDNGNVTMTVTSTNPAAIQDWSSGGLNGETLDGKRTWTGLTTGYVLKIKLWWAIAGGRAVSDEITYTVEGTEAAPDTEVPVMVKAEATTIYDTKATLTLNATDNSNGTLNYTVTIGENSYPVTGNAGKDVTIDITGLTAETEYDFSVTATDNANNVSEPKTGSFKTTTAFTLTAPEAPTVDASKVISVLSAAYTPATTWNFGGWGQTTVSENITVDDTPVIHLSKFNYIGIAGNKDGGFDPYLDLSGMTHMHFDVMPITMTGSLGVTPILATGNIKENSTKVGDNTTLKQNQWNAIDMKLSDFGLDFINNKVFQIKFDKGNTATDELYLANIYFYNNSVGEQTLGSIKLGSTLAIGTTLTTTVQAIASDGTAFVGDVTYTISDGATLTREGNTLTITGTDGTYTLTATSGDKTVTATVQLINPTSAPEPTDAAKDVLSYYSDKYKTGVKAEVYNKGWGKGYTDYKEVDLSATDKAILVIGVGTWGLNLGTKDVTDYKKLCTDIYAYEEVPYNFEWEGTSITDKGTLKEGWNHLEIALGDAVRTGAHWVKFNIGTDAKHDYTVLFDNIYATKADIKFNITTNDNVAKVVGPITAAEVEQINAADAMAIDLTGVTSIADNVEFTPSNVNAIIIVSGTEANNTPNSKYDAIKNINNVVVLGTDGWYRPVNQLVMTDIPGEPLWKGEGINKEWISTEKIGWKLTRTINAGDHASICLPSGYAIKPIPDGLSVWQPTSYNEETGITFNKKTDEINSNFPLVIRNTTDKNIELAISNEGNINFKNLIADTANKYQLGSSEGTSVWFCGNFEEAFVTNGTQWIIKNEGINASIVKAYGVKISPFRAYFTGIPKGAPAKLNFYDEETTGITNVNAAESNDGTLYNLAGQKVNAAYKGIVIKNGKKYLVK